MSESRILREFVDRLRRIETSLARLETLDRDRDRLALAATFLKIDPEDDARDLAALRDDLVAIVARLRGEFDALADLPIVPALGHAPAHPFVVIDGGRA